MKKISAIITLLFIFALSGMYGSPVRYTYVSLPEDSTGCDGLRPAVSDGLNTNGKENIIINPTNHDDPPIEPDTTLWDKPFVPDPDIEDGNDGIQISLKIKILII